MDGKLAVELIFISSVFVMITLILRRPFFYIRLHSRKVRVDTYLIGALLAPVLITIFGLINYSQIIKGLSGEGNLNPLGVLVLFLSMVFMSIYLDITGFFEYCARLALKYSKNDGRILFFSFYFIISFLTIFTSNDIIILTFTPFIYYFTKYAKIDPIPYLIAEFFAANTWSMMLYIGNPTNIVLASAFEIDFLEYLKWMFIPAVFAGLSNLFILYLIFKDKIKITIKQDTTIRPLDAITNKTGALLGITSLFGCIVALAVAPYFGIEMWIISLCFASALMIILIIRELKTIVIRKSINLQELEFTKTVKRMPIGIVPFVLSMFISIEALRIYGVTSEIGMLLKNVASQSSIYAIFLFGFSSAFVANAVNNIPMTIAYVPIIQAFSSNLQLPALFATAVGSNLGANITPIGALAGIMWMTILRNKDVDISFKEFLKYGLIVTPITLFFCLFSLAIEFLLF